ncbi:MAG: T9SS type A sorting domain-containing protein [Bacteroidales bacterium]|nr:T9SS type A sorting domain-containing protein [Bacteroidales bacterium]
MPPGAEEVEAENLKEAVDEILDELDEGDCIKELHFRGHGSNGNQSVGDGINHRVGERINGDNEWKNELGRLKDKFCEGALVHLWGCNVGRCNEGAAKLKEIADFLGVTAKGTVNKVIAGGQNMYAGPIQTATPDQPQPACMNSTDDEEPADAGNDDQHAEMELDVGISLDSIAVNPENIILELSMYSVISYNEEINVPGCPAIYPELVNFYGLIAFGSMPDPGLISFIIYELQQSLAPFEICGYPTGMNNSVLLPNYIASGTINVETGEVVGTATVLHSNDMGNFIVPNIVGGSWFPTNSEVLLLTITGPLAGPSAISSDNIGLVTYINYGNGDHATLTRDGVTGELQPGDDIMRYDIIRTYSDRVQYHDRFGGLTRMSQDAVMQMMPPRNEIMLMYPGLTHSAWYNDGEMLIRGCGDGKYRISGFIGNHELGDDKRIVFLKPGTSQDEDIYHSLDQYITAWNDHQGIWTELFELQPGYKANIQVIDSVCQLPPLIQPINADEISYINQYYLDDGLWGAPEPLTWTEPANLGPGINSEYDDLSPCLSADMLTIIFASNRSGGYGGIDLWMSTRSSLENGWSDPVNLGPNINSEYNDHFPCLSPDMLTIYFSSVRPEGYGNDDLYFSSRESASQDWEKASNIGPILNTPFREFQPFVTNGHRLYFCSDRPAGYGGKDIWTTRFDSLEGSWELPINIGPPVNTCYDEQYLSLSQNVSWLFYTSGNLPGGKGLSDFWMTARDAQDDLWKTPVNLGNPVNSIHNEWTPWICNDGVTLFFGSDRPGSYGYADIWFAEALSVDVHEPGGQVIQFPGLVCYPNPFSKETIIHFNLESDKNVTIALYNYLGTRVKTVSDNFMNAGTHEIILNSTDDKGNLLNNGMYILRLLSGSQSEAKKIIVVN